MNSSRLCLLVAVSVILVANSYADDTRPHLALEFEDGSVGRPVDSGKALGDTIYLVGDPYNPDHVSDGGIGPQVNGTFQDQFGNPGWFGWTGVDFTQSTESFWQVSDFNAISGAYSLWCGTYFDGDPGYSDDARESRAEDYQDLGMLVQNPAAGAGCDGTAAGMGEWADRGDESAACGHYDVRGQ